MSEITAVAVGAGVVRLEDGLFQGMSKLVSVDFSDCVSFNSIPASAFAECTSLTSVAGTQGLTSVGDCGFSGCRSLSGIDLPGGLTFVGTSAFAGCDQLSAVSRLCDGNSNHTFDIVGDRAFAGIPIVSASLSLRSSAIQTFWGDECFARCRNLRRVDVLSSCYMSNGMFRGCDKLSQVNFRNDHTSYVYPYVFDGCVSLSSITLPSKIWYISEGMFKGCTNLTSVGFSQYGEGAAMNFVQKNAFTGCRKLSSVSFPQSLADVSQLEDGCLSNCMQDVAKPSLVFYGIDPDGVVKSQSPDAGVIRQGRVIRLDSKTGLGKFKNVTAALDKIGCPYCVVVNQKWADNIVGCGSGETWHYADGAKYDDVAAVAGDFDGVFIYVDEFVGKDMYDNFEPQHRDMTADELANARKAFWDARSAAVKKKDADYDIFTYFYFAVSGKKSSVKKAMDLQKKPDQYAYVMSKDPSKKKSKQIGFSLNVNDQAGLRSKCGLPARTGTEGRVLYSTLVWNDAILSTGMFRLNKNCAVTMRSAPGSSSSYSRTYTYSYSDLSACQTRYQPPEKIDSDKDKTDDFSVARWYYNARELVPYAKSKNKPCLVIYSLLGCKPCQIYEKQIWSNAGFQTWAGKQNFYLCGMEVQQQPYYDQQLKYCTETLIPGAVNFQKWGDPEPSEANQFGEKFKQFYTEDGRLNQNLATPVLAFVTAPSSSGQTKTYLYTYHMIDTWIRQVGVDGVIQCLKSLCLYHFDNNDLQNAQYVREAGRRFARDEYEYDDDNPYRISPTYDDGGTVKAKLPVVVDLGRWSDINAYGKTPEGAAKAMKAVLSKVDADSAQYPEYIGGCLFQDFEWISLSLGPDKMSQAESAANADQINSALGDANLRVKIGDGVYVLQVDKTPTKKASTPCSTAPETLYKYKFVASSMPSEYRNGD